MNLQQEILMKMKIKGFLFGTEYNWSDAIRFFVATSKYQDELIMETIKYQITDIVESIDIPVYFVMGKYDCMTSPEVAEKYLTNLGGE